MAVVTEQRVEAAAEPVEGSPAITETPKRDRVSWLWWVSIVAGVVLALITALDVSRLANAFGFMLAVAVHGCLAVFIAILAHALRHKSRHQDGRRKWNWSVARWGVLSIVFAAGLVVADRFVLSLAITSAWKWFYFLSSMAAFALVLVGELAFFFSERHVNDGQRSSPNGSSSRPRARHRGGCRPAAADRRLCVAQSAGHG